MKSVPGTFMLLLHEGIIKLYGTAEGQCVSERKKEKGERERERA